MEQSVLERKPTITPTADFDVMGALDWKDGIATLPGSNIQFRLSEFGTLEIITEAEAIKTLLAPAINGSIAGLNPGASTPAATNTTAASGADSEEPKDSVPSSDIPACENCRQMDCLENGKFCTRTCSQQHKDNDSKDIPADCRNRISSRNLNVSIGCQVNEADRPLKRLRRKRKLLLDSEDEDENIDDDEEKNKSNNMKSRRNTKPLKQVVPGKKTVWNWVSYLEEERMPAAPLKLFKEATVGLGDIYTPLIVLALNLGYRWCSGLLQLVVSGPAISRSLSRIGEGQFSIFLYVLFMTGGCVMLILALLIKTLLKLIGSLNLGLL